jgi:ABC-2 type transport system permease protein
MATITTPRAEGRSLTHFLEVIKSEYWKFRTVRSTYWSVVAGVGFNVVAAALLAIFLPRAMSAHDQSTIDSTRVSLGGLHISQVAFGLLGVLVIASEYGTGMIRATLSAVPQRRLMLGAKTIVFAVAAVVIGVLSTFASYFVFQLLLPSGSALRSSLNDPGVLRAVFGAGLYLAIIGLFGLGLGAIFRFSAGAVATLLGLLFVPNLLLSLLPMNWQNTVGGYLPLEAGFSIISVRHVPHTLQPWPGLGVLCLYTGVVVIVGFFLINHRDA